MKSVIIISILAFFIVGCSQKENTIIPVYENKIEYKKIPGYLLVDNIPTPKPLTHEEYTAHEPYTVKQIAKEKKTTTLIIELYKTIGLYKLRLQSIKKWDNNMTNIVEAIPPRY